jgi:hypothetical protein
MERAMFFLNKFVWEQHWNFGGPGGVGKTTLLEEILVRLHELEYRVEPIRKHTSRKPRKKPRKRVSFPPDRMPLPQVGYSEVAGKRIEYEDYLETRNHEYLFMTDERICSNYALGHYVAEPRKGYEGGIHRTGTPRSEVWMPGIAPDTDITTSVFHFEAIPDLKNVPNCVNFYIDVSSPKIFRERNELKHSNPATLRAKMKAYLLHKEEWLRHMYDPFIPINNDHTVEEAIEQIQKHVSVKLIG